MIRQTGIEGLVIIEPKVFKDDRGYFMESFNTAIMESLGIKQTWVQDNESFSYYGTIRGLHYQCGESAQAKLVRAVTGEVLDVVVDLRKDRPTFGKVFSILLSGENKKQLLVPRGFAHGYSVLSSEAIFSYKCDNYYDRSSEGGVHPLDKTLQVDWMINEDEAIISEKDKQLPFFSEHKPIGL